MNKRRNYRKKSKKVITKKEVKTIAKAVFNKRVESKYFNTGGVVEQVPTAIQTLANMTCFGFCTGQRTDPTGSNWVYGLSQMVTLNLNRIQSPIATVPLNNMALEGMYCMPQFAQSRFLVERLGQDFSNPATLPNKALPYYMRILRLKPRVQKTSNTPINPNDDAFMDTNGLPTGVNEPGFAKLDLLTLKANSRKYQVIADIKHTMGSPLQSNLLDIASGTTNVNVQPEANFKRYDFKHDIGKKLYYKDPSSGSQIYPTNGFQQEFILFHFQALGDNSISASRAAATGVRISCNGVSTFKDA